MPWEGLIQRVLDLGFSSVAACDASPFGDWLLHITRAGYPELFPGLSSVGDPSRVLDGAKSVIVATSDYSSLSVPSAFTGRVARHYLSGLKHRPEREVYRLFKSVGWRVLTSGPRKAAAVRAGLGSYRRNSLVYSKDSGSFMSIYMWIVDREVHYNPAAVVSDCGACARCINACPTGALHAPYQVNPALCIDTQTRRRHEAIPRDLRAHMQGWVYGCDVCQSVCPYNMRGEVRPDDRAEKLASMFSLERMLHIGQGEYEAVWRPLFVFNSEVADIQRNVAVAMGNSGDDQYVRALGRALFKLCPQVRGHAAWALGRLGGRIPRDMLERARKGETDDFVREEIELALGAI